MLFVAVMVLVLAIVIVFGYRVVKELNTAVQNMDAPQEAKNITQNVQDKYVTWFDVLFLVLFTFIVIIMVVSVFFIDTHPAFAVISIILVFVTAFIGGHIANSYASFAESDSIKTEASVFKIIPYIFKHYVFILVIIGILTSIALYAKIRSSA